MSNSKALIPRDKPRTKSRVMLANVTAPFVTGESKNFAGIAPPKLLAAPAVVDTSQRQVGFGSLPEWFDSDQSGWHRIRATVNICRNICAALGPSFGGDEDTSILWTSRDCRLKGLGQFSIGYHFV